jgi:hypothetical protein
VCACLLIVCYSFLSALDSNGTESIEEGKASGYQGEDQGQADQGKPSILDAYLNPIHLLCRLHKGLLNCMFLYCYSTCSNYIVGLSSTSQIAVILRDDPSEHLSITLVVVVC